MAKNQSFLTILEQYKDRIFRICGVYAVDLGDQEDLFQEVVINLWQSWDSFQGQSHIYTWIYRITLNVCMRRHYQQKRRTEKQVQLSGISFIQPASEDVHAQVEKQEQFDQLYQCIARLKETDKSIILLFLEELPYKEIANIIGISENHVAVKVKRIKNHLYQCLKEMGHV